MSPIKFYFQGSKSNHTDDAQILFAILFACPKSNRAGDNNIAINERATQYRVTVGVNFFGVQINFRHGVHTFGAFGLLRVIEDDVQGVAGFPTESAQNRQCVFEQKLRRIPLCLGQEVGNGLSRSATTEKLGEFAEAFATANRCNADDQPPQVRKRDAADDFANAFEKSLAKRRKTVYAEHRILRVFRVYQCG